MKNRRGIDSVGAMQPKYEETRVSSGHWVTIRYISGEIENLLIREYYLF